MGECPHRIATGTRSPWPLAVIFLVTTLVVGLLPVRSAWAEGTVAKPTVVLVHGAWSSAAGWDGVAGRLRSDGYPVVTTTNPMRTLEGDAQHVREVLAGISGPIVLVGHSYGGAIVTNAAAGNPNVKALVYIAAFVPDVGESAFSLDASRLGSQVPLALIPGPTLGPDGLVIDTYLNPVLFRQVFCADVSEQTAEQMAATQRPTTLAALLEPTKQTAWRSIPSWYMVAKDDQAIPPDTERFMAQRAGSHTVEVSSAHAAMVSNPGPVAELVRAAAAAAQH
jgi:pimeloyl-ACP methyl ester carboxylesterase